MLSHKGTETQRTLPLTIQIFGFVHRAGNGLPVLGLINGSASCAGVGGGVGVETLWAWDAAGVAGRGVGVVRATCVFLFC